MINYIDQYMNEVKWSRKTAVTIIEKVVAEDMDLETKQLVMSKIAMLHNDLELQQKTFNSLMFLLLKEYSAQPLQAVATQLGMAMGETDALKAFQVGMLVIKHLRDCGLYQLHNREGEWYVESQYELDKVTKHELGKLQYLPPMQMVPQDWSNNTNGGWAYESKHAVLGSKFTKHNMPLAYDALNKLQKVEFRVDLQTYLTEKDTNHNLRKNQFLRVLKEYIDKPFYFVWRYDSRGRSYSAGC